MPYSMTRIYAPRKLSRAEKVAVWWRLHGKQSILLAIIIIGGSAFYAFAITYYATHPIRVFIGGE